MYSTARSTHPTVEANRERREAPGPHFCRVASMWSAILDRCVTPEQVVLCMAALKIAREAGQHDPDNIEDIGGYASLIPEIRQYLEPKAVGPREYAEDRFTDRNLRDR